ncbi:MAG TPA: hypothetical protein VM618_10820 [Acidimicrobiia bacterium]|nr:hypothetical protein [Acidimicrobiia bacterium]
MPVVLVVVLVATALVLAVIALGPSRRIRREGHLTNSDYYALMAGEVAAEPDGEATVDTTGDEDVSGPALGDEPIP